MTTDARRVAEAAPGRRRALGPTGAAIVGGFLAERQRTNRRQTIPHGFDQLERSGTLDNLRLAAGGDGHYRARADTSGATFPFLDSDVYKWLEAVAWELGRAPDPGLAAAADQAIGLVAAAQRPDGYLNSYVQVVGDGVPFQDLAWGHELYCTGHLIQAAVAWHRALDDDRLLAVAVRAADQADRELGPGGHDGVDGASYWQRVTRVILPLTLRTVLLVTLVSIIGSLLAFDQFYIMTAGQPQNETATSVFYVYLNSFPYLRLGYGAALSMILALTILAFTVVQLLLTRRSHA
jgi:hypothetical protein